MLHQTDPKPLALQQQRKAIKRSVYVQTTTVRDNMINRNAYTGMTAKNAALTRRSALNHAQLFHRPLKPPLRIARCRQHVVCVLNWWVSTECLLSHSLFSYLPLTHSLTRRECIPLSMTFVVFFLCQLRTRRHLFVHKSDQVYDCVLWIVILTGY